jgi:hypothetical protein
MKKKKILLAVVLSIFVFSFYSNFNHVGAAEFECGEPMTQYSDTCNCAHQEVCRGTWINYHCCGWCNSQTGFCDATPPPTPTSAPTPTPRVSIPVVDEGTLDQFNPLKQHSTKADQLSTPGGIISEVLRFAFPIAGIILFVMLILAGLKMLTGATNSKNIDEGKNMITTAILGFIILFAAYWIAQLLEIIFGIKILGN